MSFSVYSTQEDSTRHSHPAFSFLAVGDVLCKKNTVATALSACKLQKFKVIVFTRNSSVRSLKCLNEVKRG